VFVYGGSVVSVAYLLGGCDAQDLDGFVTAQLRGERSVDGKHALVLAALKGLGNLRQYGELASHCSSVPDSFARSVWVLRGNSLRRIRCVASDKRSPEV